MQFCVVGEGSTFIGFVGTVKIALAGGAVDIWWIVSFGAWAVDVWTVGNMSEELPWPRASPCTPGPCLVPQCGQGTFRSCDYRCKALETIHDRVVYKAHFVSSACLIMSPTTDILLPPPEALSHDDANGYYTQVLPTNVSTNCIWAPYVIPAARLELPPAMRSFWTGFRAKQQKFV